jgi:hypothetical protein
VALLDILGKGRLSRQEAVWRNMPDLKPISIVPFYQFSAAPVQLSFGVFAPDLLLESGTELKV